jgi:TldD protein
VLETLSTPQAGPLLERICRADPAEAACVIVRAQQVRRRMLVVVDGRVEEAASVLSRGVGAHFFDAEGRAAFASADGWEEGAADEVLRRGLRGLRLARAAGAEANPAVFADPPHRGRTNPDVAIPFDRLDLSEVAASLIDANREAAALRPGLRVRSRFLIEREEWRIQRPDGTDVTFLIPRALLTHFLALGSGGRVVTTQAGRFGTSYEVLVDPALAALALRKAAAAAELLVGQLDADDFSGGTHPIVMDHTLAKVLAHEAFGHASESDSLRSSILARDGRFRVGEAVADPAVSLVDEAIEGDYAWQPWDSHGVPRRRATILRDGVLHEALSDLFSAARAGVPVTGAARAESYASVPVPRMSNIRIELREPLPLEHREETPPPPELVRDALLREGILCDARPRVVYLMGFRGGQVNTARGDFVFNCQALHDITRDGLRLHRPSIFSGSCLEALRSIRAGFGPLRLDSSGTCGKAGQGVPSCGGSHRLLFLEASPEVRLGGRERP